MYAFVYLSRIDFIIMFYNKIVLFYPSVRMFPETIAAENSAFPWK